MEESNAIAVVDSGAPVEAPSSPAVIPPAVEPPVRTAVTGDMVPRTQSTVAERQAGEPARLTPDNKVSSEWMDWMISNLPSAVEPDANAPESLRKFGMNMSELEETLGLVNGLYEPNGAGVVPALNAIIARSPETFERIRNLVIADNPHLAFKQSMALLGIPDVEPPENDLGDLARVIPVDLQAVARTVPRDTLEEWAIQGEDVLAYNLSQESRRLEMWREQTEKSERQWKQAIERADTDGQANLAALIGQYEDEHYKELSKWKPFGDEKTDEVVRRMAFAGALDLLLSDQKWLDIHQRMCALTTAAPNGRLFEQHTLADQAEREARQLMQRFSVRLGQMIRDKVRLLDQAIHGAVEEAKPEEKPDPEPPKNINGKINDKWVDWLVRDQQRKRGANAAV